MYGDEGGREENEASGTTLQARRTQTVE